MAREPGHEDKIAHLARMSKPRPSHGLWRARGRCGGMNVMNASSDPVLDELRAATARPSWVQMNYAIEKIHTNMLVAALNKGEAREARALAAALWRDASEEAIDPETITRIKATPEFQLKQGAHGTVDLLVELDAGGATRRLAIEVKVDTAPWQQQLESMSKALGEGPHQRLVLLCLGAAQALRVEPNGTLPLRVKRWSVANVLPLRDLIVAASPVKADAEAWLDELGREEQRRAFAWTDDALLAECGYRDRLLTAYRYGDIAATSPGWEVSLQAFGVVLHGDGSHQKISESVTLYLEVADGTLRVKAGAWYDKSVPLGEAEKFRSLIGKALTDAGFTVEDGQRRRSSTVSLLLLDRQKDGWPREHFAERLERALAAWKAIDWRG